MRKTVAVILCLSVLLSACNDETQNNINELGGNGRLQNLNDQCCMGNMYDDENLYFLHVLCTKVSGPIYSYIKLTKEGEVLANCKLPTCTHIDNENCEARTYYHYFRFGEHLYKYGDFGNKIYDGEKPSEVCVYTQTIPEELHEEDADEEIEGMRILNDQYAIIINQSYQYVIDHSFNKVFAITDVGDSSWAKYYQNAIYYVNDMQQLVQINTTTWEAKPVELDTFVFRPADSPEKQEEYIFYVTPTRPYSLYRYSVRTRQNVKLRDDFTTFIFSVHCGYLYCETSEFEGAEKVLLDYEGNLVKDLTQCTNLSTKSMSFVQGRLYSFKELGLGPTGFTITSMDPDGSDYHEYWME